MNNELSEVIKTYATKSHKEFSNLLLDKSKDQSVSLLSSLLKLEENLLLVKRNRRIFNN